MAQLPYDSTDALQRLQAQRDARRARASQEAHAEQQSLHGSQFVERLFDLLHANQVRLPTPATDDGCHQLLLRPPYPPDFIVPPGNALKQGYRFVLPFGDYVLTIGASEHRVYYAMLSRNGLPAWWHEFTTDDAVSAWLVDQIAAHEILPATDDPLVSADKRTRSILLSE